MRVIPWQGVERVVILEEGPLHRMVFSVVARIWRVVPAVPAGGADWAKPVLLVLVLAGQVGGQYSVLA